jgi:hypothetical protein
MTGTLHRVVLPYACSGVIVAGGRVVHSAPIARWPTGTTLQQLAARVGKQEGVLAPLFA